MQQDSERLNVLFHNRAKPVYAGLFDEFAASPAARNRQRQDHQFHQARAQYTNRLKQELDHIAAELLRQAANHADMDGWNRMLAGFIEAYVQEFTLKAKSL